MQLDAIRNRARADLILTTEHGEEDVVLWEHAVRVAENARRIARLPEVRAASPDDVALTAAALYHDAGWAARHRNEEIRREEVLVCPRTDSQREEAAIILERRLADLLPPESIERAAATVRVLHQRDVQLIEAEIVTEADTLDEFGVLSLWLTMRRGVVSGKGVQYVIDTWERRRQFRYWDALLDGAFRYASVRAVAETRLQQLEAFMEQLIAQHCGEDLERALDAEGVSPGGR